MVRGGIGKVKMMIFPEIPESSGSLHGSVKTCPQISLRTKQSFKKGSLVLGQRLMSGFLE